MSSGGRRGGSGRKPMDEGARRVLVTVRVLPSTKESMRKLKQEGVSVGEKIDELFKKE